MLFLPESVYAARRRLWRQFESGRINGPEVFQKKLELDPNDYIAIVQLGRLKKEAGDVEGAKEYFWRAVQSQPCVSSPYLELSQLYSQEPENADLAEALGELGISKRLDDIEDVAGRLDFKKPGFDEKASEEHARTTDAFDPRWNRGQVSGQIEGAGLAPVRALKEFRKPPTATQGKLLVLAMREKRGARAKSRNREVAAAAFCAANTGSGLSGCRKR